MNSLFCLAECSEYLENVSKSGIVQTNPDHLVQSIEKVTAIFERVRKGHAFEVEVICAILPNIFSDFFSPSDVLTKVIGEFLSTQQPHPKLLSKVVFQVSYTFLIDLFVFKMKLLQFSDFTFVYSNCLLALFCATLKTVSNIYPNYFWFLHCYACSIEFSFKVFESAIKQSQLTLLQDWVIFSLSNFTQSLSVGMATWYLTCFFISASTDDWLRSFFPHIQARIGRYEYEDRKMLCIAGVDFYKNLTSEKQKQMFVENFQAVKDHSDMPFSDLLASL